MHKVAEIVTTISVSATVGFIAYAVFGLWFGGLFDYWISIETLKHQTCWTSYRFIESLQQNVVYVSYCGEAQ